MTFPGIAEREDDIQKKVCMVGSFGVGKTSLVRRFVESIFDARYHTTVGVKIDRKRVEVDTVGVNVVLWDLAGEDELAKLRRTHLRGTSGYILVADGTREKTIDDAVALQGQLADLVGDVPFVFAVNKVDLADQWKLSTVQLTTLIEKGWTVFRTSALTGEGVENLFTMLARNMLRNNDERVSD